MHDILFAYKTTFCLCGCKTQTNIHTYMYTHNFQKTISKTRSTDSWHALAVGTRLIKKKLERLHHNIFHAKTAKLYKRVWAWLKTCEIKGGAHEMVAMMLIEGCTLFIQLGCFVCVHQVYIHISLLKL